jgi:hypothetical protein
MSNWTDLLQQSYKGGGKVCLHEVPAGWETTKQIQKKFGMKSDTSTRVHLERLVKMGKCEKRICFVRLKRNTSRTFVWRIKGNKE